MKIRRHSGSSPFAQGVLGLVLELFFLWLHLQRIFAGMPPLRLTSGKQRAFFASDQPRLVVAIDATQGRHERFAPCDRGVERFAGRCSPTNGAYARANRAPRRRQTGAVSGPTRRAPGLGSEVMLR